MTQDTTFVYETARGRVCFSYDSDFWISDISGFGSEVTLSATQGAGQSGETVNAQSVQPKNLTVNGSIVGDVEAHRARMLAVMAPLLPGRFTVVQGGAAWHLNGVLTKAPLFSDGDVIQTFQFSFRAPYPYWRAEDVRVELAGLTALWRTPFRMSGTRKISEFTPDMFKLLPNLGDTAQAFKCVFYAAHEVVNPSLHNADENTHIKILRTLAPGERWEISTRGEDKDAGNGVLRYPAGQARAENGFAGVAPDSDLDMCIAPGGNILLADAAEGKQNLRCTLYTAGGERHSL